MVFVFEVLTTCCPPYGMVFVFEVPTTSRCCPPYGMVFVFEVPTTSRCCPPNGMVFVFEVPTTSRCCPPYGMIFVFEVPMTSCIFVFTALIFLGILHGQRLYKLVVGVAKPGKKNQKAETAELEYWSFASKEDVYFCKEVCFYNLKDLIHIIYTKIYTDNSGLAKDTSCSSSHS